MKNKSVQNCRCLHHAKFHCIMTTLNRLFKIEVERGETGKEPKKSVGKILLKNYHPEIVIFKMGGLWEVPLH